MLMTSTKPYLIRAFYEWIADNNCTPHIVVNAELPDVEVPQEYVDGGQIVLNISMSAVQNLDMGDESISFNARFSGIPKSIYVPLESIMAIYARENGRGMVFAEEEHHASGSNLHAVETDTDTDTDLDDDDEPTPPTSPKTSKRKGGNKSGKSHLTVVK